MRSLLTLIIGAAVAGLGLGAVLGYLEAQPWTVVDPASLTVETAAPDPVDLERRPQVEVPEHLYNFGSMEQGTTLNHAFTVRNVGDKPLTLSVASTTCKCTVGDLENNEVAPGEETEVMLEWTAKSQVGPFRHGATLSTNDPKNMSVSLTVEGEVVASTSVIPGELIFGGVAAGTEVQREVFILSRFQEEVEVTNFQFSNSSLNDQLDIEIVPAQPDEFPVDDAKGAVKVVAKLHKERTIGRFFGWLEVDTNLESAPKLNIPITGNTIGDISIFGPGWDPKLSLLRMGAVRSGEGKVARLNLSTRGEHAQSTEFEVVRTSPPELKASLGEKKEINDTLVHMPLLLEIPSGTPPMVRLGEPASSDALVVLKTTHPNAKEVQLRVNFSVEP